jgi:hypothetical protein
MGQPITEETQRAVWGFDYAVNVDHETLQIGMKRGKA